MYAVKDMNAVENVKATDNGYEALKTRLRRRIRRARRMREEQARLALKAANGAKI